MTNLNAVIPILMHLFIFLLKSCTICTKRQVPWAAVKANASQWDATLRDDVGFATVYRRIYRRKFLTLSNRTSRYKRKCIRISDHYLGLFDHLRQFVQFCSLSPFAVLTNIHILLWYHLIFYGSWHAPLVSLAETMLIKYIVHWISTLTH